MHSALYVLTSGAHWPLVALWGVLLALCLREFRAHKDSRANRALLAVAGVASLLGMAEHSFLGILSMNAAPQAPDRAGDIWSDPMFTLNLLNGAAVLPLLGILLGWVSPSLRRERREYEHRRRALREEREFKVAVFEALQALVVVLDREGRITAFNRFCEDLTGRRSEEVYGLRLWDAVLCSAGAERMEAMFLEACKEPGRGRRVESLWVGRDGTPRVIAWSSCAVTSGDRNRAVIATGIDITGERAAVEEIARAYEQMEQLVSARTAELERANVALRRNEERLAEAQRIAHIGSWEWEVGARHLYQSDEIFRIFGLPFEDAGSATLSDFWRHVHPGDQSALDRAIDSALAGRGTIDLDHRILRPDGSERIVHAQAHVVFDESGVPRRVVGTIQDITTRRRAQTALERAHEELERRVEERTAALLAANRALGFTQFAVDNAGDAIFWLGQDSRILYVNDAARRHLDYPKEQLLRMRVADFAPAYGPRDAWEETWAALRRDGRAGFESIHVRSDGTEIPVEIVASYLEYEKREYVCAFVRDISQRRRMEELLRRQHEAEKVVFQIASRFVDRDTAAALQQGLRDLGRLTGAQCVCVMQRRDDGTFDKFEFWYSHERQSCRTCSLEKAESVSLDEWIKPLEDGSLVFLGERIGPLDAPHRAGARILVPVFCSDALSAVIALEGVQYGGGADRTDFTLVQIAAKSIGNAMARHGAETRTLILLDENRRLARESITAQEEERAYLARELHDELGQSLTAIRADAGSIARLSRESDRRIHESAQAIVDVSTRVYQVVRALMQRMRPDVLDSLGLVEAVRELVDEWRSRRPDLAWELQTSGVPERLPGGIGISAYRIVQECVTNVIKHAEASSITISLSEHRYGGCRSVEVSVADDGRGMDHTGNSRGTGLAGMRERALSADGEFAVRSRPGGGTAVSALFPLDAPHPCLSS